MPVSQVTIWRFKCERCGYEWTTRDNKWPIRCAKCRSAYWNRPKVSRKSSVGMKLPKIQQAEAQ